MHYSDTFQIKADIRKQTELLKRITAASERTNTLLYEMLSPEQRQSLQQKDAQNLAKKTNKVRQP